MVRFAWDKNKARSNFLKHGVTFEEARSVFFENPMVFIDPDSSSADEDRLIAIWFSHLHKMLVVVHCYREEVETIRIISARKSTKGKKRKFTSK